NRQARARGRGNVFPLDLRTSQLQGLVFGIGNDERHAIQTDLRAELENSRLEIPHVPATHADLPAAIPPLGSQTSRRGYAEFKKESAVHGDRVAQPGNYRWRMEAARPVRLPLSGRDGQSDGESCFTLFSSGSPGFPGSRASRFPWPAGDSWGPTARASESARFQGARPNAYSRNGSSGCGP